MSVKVRARYVLEVQSPFFHSQPLHFSEQIDYRSSLFYPLRRYLFPDTLRRWFIRSQCLLSQYERSNLSLNGDNVLTIVLVTPRLLTRIHSEVLVDTAVSSSDNSFDGQLTPGVLQ